MRRKKASLFTAALGFILSVQFAQSAETYEVSLQRDVPAKMRDGVVLHADIYRPKPDGKFPVLLQRTPYDKRNSVEFAFQSRGIAGICRHCSGCARTLHIGRRIVHVQT